MRDLPPLKALRAFEACYRLRSFTRAAGTLNVGQPAISHQIRLLERDLGVELFEKRGSVIHATEEADTLYAAIAPAFFSIVEASRSIRRAASTNDVTLATYSGIAAYWISPRLLDYASRRMTFPSESSPPIVMTRSCWQMSIAPFCSDAASGLDSKPSSSFRRKSSPSPPRRSPTNSTVSRRRPDPARAPHPSRRP